MNREIKLRAWHKRIKQMFAINCIDWKHELVYCEGEDGNTHTFGFIDIELRQYTEEKDKNGNEIYDGGVIKVLDPDKKHQIQEIRFIDGAFCGYSDRKECKYTFLEVLIKAHGVEVIGNIDEHPHLMEEPYHA